MNHLTLRFAALAMMSGAALGCSSSQPATGDQDQRAAGGGGTAAGSPSSPGGAGTNSDGGTGQGGLAVVGVGAATSGSGGQLNDGGGSGGGSAGASGSNPGSTACSPPDSSSRTLHVSPSGTANGDGVTFDTAYDVATGIAKAEPGDVLLLQPGKYAIPYVQGSKNTLNLAQKGAADRPIRIVTQGGGRAELDFSFPEQAWVQDSYGLLVSGSYWSLCGVDVTRAGYQGAYVTGAHNTFENCTFHDNRNTGLEINKGGSHTTVINCDAYRNYDPKKLGSMADGFGPKETQGPGNVFIGCRAWENSDDGFDAYESDQNVVFERCFAFRNGVDVWGYGEFSGNGNGFKIGGNSKQANHRLTRCVAFENPVKGFDQNNNTGGVTLHHCTAYKNGTNFALGGALNDGQSHDLRNNVSFGANDTIANATQLNNAWTLSLAVTNADFKGLDTTQGTAPRAPDGALPMGDLLRPSATSSLLDRGVDVGLPFHGAAPDLGAFEAD